MIRKTNPNRAKNADVIDTLAAEKRRLRKMVTGSIGWATRSSQRTNTPSSTAATAKPPNVWADSQPHSGASMIVYTRALIAAIDRATPVPIEAWCVAVT